LQQAHYRPAGEGPHHQHLAVGKVDQVDDAVNHGVAKRDQRVHTPQDQAIDDLLKKDIDGASPRGCRIVGKKKPSARGGLGIHTN